MPSARAVVREDTGTALACVGTRYVPIQPAEAMELAEALAHGQSATLQAPVVLAGGADVVFKAKGDEFKIGSDVVRAEVWVRTNNTGRAPLTASLRLWRKVCSNGMFVVMAGRGVSVRIRHVASGAERVRMLAGMGRAFSQARETATETIIRMMATPLDAKGGALRAYYERVMPIPQAAADASAAEIAKVQEQVRHITAIRRDWAGTFLRELDERDAGAANGPNVWLAMNSVTNWAQHRMPIRGARQHPERREYANLPGGAGAELTERAYTAAVGLLK